MDPASFVAAFALGREPSPPKVETPAPAPVVRVEPPVVPAPVRRPAAPPPPVKKWYTLSNEPGLEGFGPLLPDGTVQVEERRWAPVCSPARPAPALAPSAYCYGIGPPSR